MTESVTLLAWLLERPRQAIVALLRDRPDLASPVPQNTRILATRAGSRTSVARACDRLNAFELAVLEAAVLCEADTRPATRAGLAAWFGPEVRAEDLDTTVERLRELALFWGEDPYQVPGAVREVTGEFPAGLGRAVDSFAETDITAELAALDEKQRGLVETLAAGPPIGQTRDAAKLVPIEQARTPVQALLARGMLLRRDEQTVELPRQVALAVRGEYPIGRVSARAPVPATVPRSAAEVDKAAAGEAMTLLRHAEAILTTWSHTPAALLRSGGAAVRDLRKLVKELDVDEQRVSLLVEVLTGAGLAATDQDAGVWVPTTAADGWFAADPATRWATLAGAWLELPRLPWLAGLKDAKDRAIAPLTEELHRPLAPESRRMVLEAIAELGPGTALDGPDTLIALLNWRTPRQSSKLRDKAIIETIREATALGVLALGACGTPGRALLTELDSAAAAMAGALPDPVEHILVQADLTAIAPGPLEPELAAAMSLVGDVESAGGATVYRIGESSVRRALDAGRSAAELHELFRVHSATPVPQSLSYLIDDVARKHGQLRGGMAGSFLRSTDPALLAEVLAGPAAARLELRRIADEVVISPAPLVDVLDVLREHGYSPIAEGPDGQLLDLRPPGRRVPARSANRTHRSQPEPPDPDRLAEAVDSMRAADRAAAAKRGAAVAALSGAGASDTLSATLSALRDAVRERETVWVGLVDTRGTASQHVLVPTRLGGGVLEGEDPDTGEATRLPLHLITTVATVTD
ncbi:helicase-associated domain-containing protein [Sciscionella marina]|uniref:helicase-associated domain-containing protein n=1 Tax=Sciscionella marina TaxID=508770 RepID=UPI0003732DD0|nr:helicase-associated domain-containing protein [Sciscionella marina]